MLFAISPTSPSPHSSPRPAARFPIGRVRYARTLRILGVLYAAAAVAFIFYPSEALDVVNWGPRLLKNFEVIPPPAENLWSVWAGTNCVTLAAISFLGAESPRVRGYGLAHLLAKTVGALSFFYFFMNFQKYFVYLLAGVLETGIFVLVLWRLLRSGATAEARSAPKDGPVL